MITVAIAFALGVLLGVWATRTDTGRRMPWGKLIRAQLIGVAVTLSFFAAWRLETPKDLAVPAALEGAFIVVVLAACVIGGWNGPSMLRSWAALSNTGFWVIPVAAALLGPGAVVVATLADRAGAARVAVATHLLRRDAPEPQETRTAWIDQSPVLALAVGLVNYLPLKGEASR